MLASDAVALRIAGDLVEHHRGIAHLPHIDVDEATDLFLGLGAFDGLELAGGFDALDPVPQILVGHVTLPECPAPVRRIYFLVSPTHR